MQDKITRNFSLQSRPTVFHYYYIYIFSNCLTIEGRNKSRGTLYTYTQDSTAICTNTVHKPGPNHAQTAITLLPSVILEHINNIFLWRKEKRKKWPLLSVNKTIHQLNEWAEKLTPLVMTHKKSGTCRRVKVFLPLKTNAATCISARKQNY